MKTWVGGARELNRQGKKDAKGRWGSAFILTERVHSERCRDADILSGVDS